MGSGSPYFEPSAARTSGSWTPDGAYPRGSPSMPHSMGGLSGRPMARASRFSSNRKGSYNLYQKLSSGAESDELLLESDRNKEPNDWSSDGRFLLFNEVDPQTSWDLLVLPVSGHKKPFPFLESPFDERNGQFSPDAKWIVYQSNESGRFEIYIQPFPGVGAKIQIS